MRYETLQTIGSVDAYRFANASLSCSELVAGSSMRICEPHDERDLNGVRGIQ